MGNTTRTAEQWWAWHDADADRHSADMATAEGYTFTIFDSNPNSSSGTAWDTHTDVELEAASDEAAVAEVRETMGIEAAGLSPSDGYEVGQRLYAIVWDEEGTIVGQPTYELTHEDLGVPTDEERAAERLARAAKSIGAQDIGDGNWAHEDDATSRWHVVTAGDLAKLCDYLDDEQTSRDAYSRWCADTTSEQMPAGWDPSITADTVARWISVVNFVTPPENQGQIVLVSYGCDAEHIYERVFDQSDRTTTVNVYEHDDEDEDWSPWNAAPSLGEKIYTFELH